MKQLYAISILIFLFAGYAKAQETHVIQQPVTTQDEVNSSLNIDIAKIKLPPLSVLYEMPSEIFRTALPITLARPPTRPLL